MQNAKGLNPKQQRFVDEYLIDLNATQAAIRAGYSVKTANQIGPRLLVNVGVRAAVAKRQAKIAEKAGLTLQSHLDRLNELANRAADAEQFGPAVSAEVSRGRASGFYVDRTETKHSGKIEVRVRFEREGRRVTAS